MLQSYDELRGDLVRDDLNAARTKAQAIVRVSGDWKDVVVPARAIAVSGSLDSLASLSKEAIRLAHRQPGYFIMRCTMDGCQAPCSDCRSNDYGSWVQMSTSIGNPFMGKLSPNCGARPKEIPP